MSFKKLALFISRAETVTLSILLIVMILLAFINIVSRNTGSGGIIWADKMLIFITLWIAAVGSATATTEEGHISISLAKYIPGRILQNQIKLFRHLVSAGVALLLAFYSLKLVLLEYPEHYSIIPFLESWVPMVILPPCFLLMSLKYVIHIINDIKRIVYHTMPDKER